MNSYDVIVIGGGTMGTAAGWALGKRGVRALVLEQFQHVHSLGSHSGETRITRRAYAESPEYVPLVEQSEALWRDLAASAQVELLIRCGGLDLQAPGFTHASNARRSAQLHHVPHEWLAGTDVRQRWPAWSIPDDWEACYCPDTSMLLVEPCLRSMASAAMDLGVTLKTGEGALGWRADAHGVSVQTNRAEYQAGALIVAAGAWSNPVLEDLGLPLTVRRKPIWWFAPRDPVLLGVGQFPIFIADGPMGAIYGLPLHVGEGVKIANHSGGEPTTADTVDRVVHPDEGTEVAAFIRSMLPAVTTEPLRSGVCLYTLTPDTDFVVDRHPSFPNVSIAAGFSGHGFKFAPLIGEQLASLALDPVARPIPRFAIARFSL